MIYTEIIVLITIGVLGIKRIDCQIVPANPCPNVFNYHTNNGEVFGRLEFQNDRSGLYELSVNMSVAVFLTDNKKISLELKTSEQDLSLGRSLVYHVHFPTQDVLPKPTRIEFNKRVYCTGLPEELRPGKGVSNVWASTYNLIPYPIGPTKPNRGSMIDIIKAVPELDFDIPANSPQFINLPPAVYPNLQPIGNTLPPVTTFQRPTTEPPNGFVNIDSIPFERDNDYVTNKQVINSEKVEAGKNPSNVNITHTQNIQYQIQVRNGDVVSNKTIIKGDYVVVENT